MGDQGIINIPCQVDQRKEAPPQSSLHPPDWGKLETDRHESADNSTEHAEVKLPPPQCRLPARSVKSQGVSSRTQRLDSDEKRHYVVISRSGAAVYSLSAANLVTMGLGAKSGELSPPSSCFNAPTSESSLVLFR